jgi:hypothetical protein
MAHQKLFSVKGLSFYCLALVILSTLALAQKQPAEPSSEEAWKRRLAEGRRQMLGPTVGLEVISSRKTEPVYKGAVSHFTIARDALAIANLEVAKDFSFVEVQAEIGADVINVRILVNYNKLSEPESWKNQKEKEVGRFTIPIGESLRLAELLQFGIEPFEIKVISSKPVALKREEYPRIYNSSTALEVTEVEKSPIGYRFSIKNISNKDIAVLEARSGSEGLGGGELGYREQQPFLPSGETYEGLYSLSALNVEKYGLTIKMILYSDGTYEGDAISATRHLARNEGYKVQAAKLLPGLDQAFNVADEELPDFLIKMEANLWQMPEAMDKASSIEFLQIKYPAFDEQTISALYEEFKSGFYNARNTLLTDLGQIKRRIEEQRLQETNTDRVKVFRHILTRLKEIMVKATSSSI